MTDIQLAPEAPDLSPFERQALHIPGQLGELLRAIARAEANGRQHGMTEAEQWRWSKTVVTAKRIAREWNGGRP